MIALHTATGDSAEARLDDAASELPADIAWIDVYKPDAAEIALLKRVSGLDLPTLEQLSEVEVSSRLRREGDALFLSLPVVFRDNRRLARITPVGIIVAADRLVTVRFEDLKAFQTCRERVERHELSKASATAIFVALLEAIVDRLADILEEVGAELDSISEEVFGPDLEKKPTRRPKQQGLRLRRTLRRVGMARQLASKVRATLLAIGRIVPYVESEGADWLPDDVKPRIEWVGHDVGSLDEYEVHLADKIQFLLDADLGLINIEQNDLFRILTVVSIVGIPPTLIASMYGMNFKRMPELDWVYGYPYGLTLIALSALAPLLFFRLKGWF